MSNATLTTVKQEYDLTTESGLIRLAQDAGRDFKFKMMIVVEYWCKPVQEGGQGKKIEDLASKINRSPKTLKTDYVSVLRKEGRLPAAPKRGVHAISAGRPAKPVENSSTTVQTLCSQSLHHEERRYTEPSISSTVQVVQPIVYTYNEGSEERAVSMCSEAQKSAWFPFV